MQPSEILKAIDPKGVEIEELKKVIQGRDAMMESLQNDLQKHQRHEIEREWMRQHGVMLETTEGMKYLKDDDYDAFFKRLKIKQSSIRIGTLDNDVNPLTSMGPLEYEFITEEEDATDKP